MAIHLVNRTHYDTQLLKDVFTFAARKIKVKGVVAVCITETKYDTCYATTYRGFPPPHWKKRGRPLPKSYVKFRIPKPKLFPKYHTLTEEELKTVSKPFNLLHVALHEMSHVLDDRTPKLFVQQWHEVGGNVVSYAGRKMDDFGSVRKMRYGRRIAHDKRPCEIMAENRAYDTCQDSISRKRMLELNNAVLAEAERLKACPATKSTKPTSGSPKRKRKYRSRRRS